MAARTRRQFLREGGALLGAAALAPLSIHVSSRTPQAKRILLIGAGAAGLSAAYELNRGGHDVLVFEAKMFPGGRIRTLRAPFADGLYAEAGAMYLPDGHDLTMRYARELDLPLVAVTPRQGFAALFHIAGARIPVLPGQVPTWPLELGPNERGKTIGALKAQYWFSKAAAVEGLLDDDWPRASHRDFDRITLAEYWRRQGASEAAIRLMAVGYLDGMGDGVGSYSALLAMRDEASLAPSRTYYRIRGGSDLLPHGLAERLGTKVRYGSAVVAIRHDDRSVELTVEDATGRHQVAGDYAVCTVPFPVMRRIPTTPPLSSIRRRAIEEITSTSVTRVYLQCRERFWERDGLMGSAATELPISSVFHSTDSQPGVRGILESFATGARARRLGAMSIDERAGFVVREMAKLHPRIAEFVEGSAAVVWDDDRWALGDFAYFKPGQISEFFPHIQRPEGRLHFAGDTVGALPGWMQGAFASGALAARRIAASA